MVNSWPPKTQRKDAGDAIKALTKIVGKVGELINCSAPSSAALPKWISQAAETHGKTMAPQAARMLAEWIGADLARLDGEIEKLVLYVGDRKEISSADVSAVAVATGGYEPFALTNAIGRRDTRKALTILAAMLTSRGEEIKTLGMLAWHVRKNVSQARPDSPAATKARRDTRKLLAADLAIKSGADSATTMQLLVMELAGTRN
jgi:DNA polymerase III delta subunit